MKKFLLLCMMVLGLGGFSANAVKVYFDNSVGNWSGDIYCHYWTDGGASTTWPGFKMTSEGNNLYSYEITDGSEMVIFNNNAGKQTSNLILKDGKTYNANSVSMFTIYFENKVAKYTTPYIYTWGPDQFGGWPGKEMEHYKGTVYTKEIVACSGMKITDAGNGGKDITSIKNNAVYDKDGKVIGDIATYEIEEVDPNQPVEPDVITWTIKGEIFTGDWNNGAVIEMTQENGKWVLEKEITKAGGFGVKTIKNHDLESQVTWYSFAANTDVNSNLGEALPLLTSGSNGKFSEVGKYRFVVDADALTLTVTKVDSEEPGPITPNPEVVDLYFRGGLNDWGTSNPFTSTDGKTYTIESIVLAGKGIYKVGNADWTPKYTYGKGATVTDTNLSTTLEPADGMGEDLNASYNLLGEYSVVYNAETHVITFAKVGEVEPEKIECPSALYLIGHVKDRVDQYGWDATKALELKKEGRVFTAEKVPFIGADGTAYGYFRFSEAAGAWSVVDLATQYGAESKDKDVEENVAMSLEKGYNSFKIAAGLYNITIEFGDYAATIKVVPFKHAQPVIKHNGQALTHGATVKVTTTNFGDDEDPFHVILFDYEKVEGATLFISAPGFMNNGGLLNTRASEEEVIEHDGKYFFNMDNENFWVGDQVWVPAADGEHSFMLVENGQPGEVLTVTAQNGTTGVATIEAAAGEAVYFNLQGQRVANPENGMYIRVVNGKASKVAL